MGLDASDKQRIAGRKWADEVIEEAMTNGADFLIGFARATRVAFPPDAAKLHAMTDDEARAFEAGEISFGKHKGAAWGEVPIAYIGWMAENNRPLQEYVRSETFKRRQEEEDDKS